jgi:hypothetical protein
LIAWYPCEVHVSGQGGGQSRSSRVGKSGEFISHVGC